MHLMGIINVTPDSFSDGGFWDHAELAIARGHELVKQGATILDIGGESTRPGATALSADEEWKRIEPVLNALAGGRALPTGSSGPCGALISVDTYHASTARRAYEAGATIINDVTGGRGDCAMFATVAELGCDYILQHSRGPAASSNEYATYSDHVAVQVREELLAARDEAVEAGIAPERIILDPGLGFSKVGDHDWDALAGISDIAKKSGHRLLIGPSRKRFLAEVSAPIGSAATDRDIATAALCSHLALACDNIWAVRVHNIADTAVALNVAKKYQYALDKYDLYKKSSF